MSDLMLEKLSDVSLATLVVIVIFISLLVQFLLPLFNKLRDRIIRKYKKDEKDSNLQDLIDSHEAKIKEYANNRIHDREQSFEIQRQLVNSISELKDRLDRLNELQESRYLESIERENKRVRAELKDRISQSYRIYKTTKKWNSMEKEALEDLILEYEDAGGRNSFVHSVVQKEMYTWDLTDQD